MLATKTDVAYNKALLAFAATLDSETQGVLLSVLAAAMDVLASKEGSMIIAHDSGGVGVGHVMALGNPLLMEALANSTAMTIASIYAVPEGFKQ